MYAGYRILCNFIENGAGYYRILVYKKTKTGSLKKAFVEKIPVFEIEYVSLLYGDEIR